MLKHSYRHRVTVICKTKPTDAAQKLRDGRGLYLLTHPNGGRWWRWDYHSVPLQSDAIWGAIGEYSLLEERRCLQVGYAGIAVLLRERACA